MPKFDGPDISHWNPVYDWDAIPQFDLFSTKATEGRSFVSPKFHEYWREMKRRNFKYRGAYHWITGNPAHTVAAQINNLKRALAVHGGLQPGEFIQLDWERTENSAWPYPTLAKVNAWIAEAEKVWPGRIIVYASDWVRHFPAWRAANPTYPLWYANYNLSSKPTGGPAETKKFGAHVWQWTSSASVAGFSGRIDMNEVLDWSIFPALTATLPPPPPPPPEEDEDMQIRFTTTNREGQFLIPGGTLLTPAMVAALGDVQRVVGDGPDEDARWDQLKAAWDASQVAPDEITVTVPPITPPKWPNMIGSINLSPDA